MKWPTSATHISLFRTSGATALRLRNSTMAIAGGGAFTGEGDGTVRVGTTSPTSQPSIRTNPEATFLGERLEKRKAMTRVWASSEKKPMEPSV